MFTGIIEGIGTVISIERASEHAHVTVSARPSLLEGVALGDSIAVNGVCLTVVDQTETTLSFDAVYETMRRTSLGHLATGDFINFERSMAANGRFGGHIVQGHVDNTGTVASIRQVDNSFVIYIDVPRDLMKYIVSKGSITVDGISLTVVDAEDRTFSVSIIPHTWENTNLSQRRAGDPVNIETDIIGKYVERMMASQFDGRGVRQMDSGGDLYGGFPLDDPTLRPSRAELM
jgi:riboflavin synthase